VERRVRHGDLLVARDIGLDAVDQRQHARAVGRNAHRVERAGQRLQRAGVTVTGTDAVLWNPNVMMMRGWSPATR